MPTAGPRLDPTHQAIFRLAHRTAGDDDKAASTTSCFCRAAVHVHALLNAAVIYEIAREYDRPAVRPEGPVDLARTNGPPLPQGRLAGKDDHR
jgi:hypothetical protein